MNESFEQSKKPLYKRWWFLLGVVILLGSIYSASSEDSDVRVDNPVSAELAYHQVGYYKGENNLRYFTVFVGGNDSSEIDTENMDLLQDVRRHGSTQSNTKGQVTATFYYRDRASTPDITLLDAERANDAAHAARPFAAVWILPSGDINLIENPE